jgi:type VI secretion system secreted protein Hcp
VSRQVDGDEPKTLAERPIELADEGARGRRIAVNEHCRGSRALRFVNRDRSIWPFDLPRFHDSPFLGLADLDRDAPAKKRMLGALLLEGPKSKTGEPASRVAPFRLAGRDWFREMPYLLKPSSQGVRSMSVQMFLKLDGIAGESADAKHKGEIDILGWSWGLSGPEPSSPSGGGAGRGRAAIRNLMIQKLVDLSSPLLLLASAEGRLIRDGTLTTRRAGANGAEFLLFKMTDVIVASVAVTATADEGPTESVALAFGKVEFDYSPTLPDGSLGPEKSFRWDVVANRPF